MELQRSIFDDDTGVSPVIGVILMVAVTVIIAAVIGSSVLGMADSASETPPQASLSIEQGQYNVKESGGTHTFSPVVNIKHQSGDKIEYSNLEITVDGKTAQSFVAKSEPAPYGSSGGPWVADATSEYFNQNSPFTAGDTIMILTASSEISNNRDRVMEMEENGNDLEWRDLSSTNDYLGTVGSNDWTFEPGQTVRVTWTSGDSSSILYEYEIQE